MKKRGIVAATVFLLILIIVIVIFFSQYKAEKIPEERTDIATIIYSKYIAVDSGEEYQYIISVDEDGNYYYEKQHHEITISGTNGNTIERGTLKDRKEFESNIKKVKDFEEFIYDYEIGNINSLKELEEMLFGEE